MHAPHDGTLHILTRKFKLVVDPRRHGLLDVGSHARAADFEKDIGSHQGINDVAGEGIVDPDAEVAELVVVEPREFRPRQRLGELVAKDLVEVPARFEAL